MNGTYDDHPYGYLTTRGRVTGTPHTIEIWFADTDHTVYMLSGGRDRSDWVRNILANGEASIRIGNDELSGVGRVVEDADEQRIARRTVFEKYQPGYGSDLTRWRETSLPLAIDLAPE